MNSDTCLPKLQTNKLIIYNLIALLAAFKSCPMDNSQMSDFMDCDCGQSQ